MDTTRCPVDETLQREQATRRNAIVHSRWSSSPTTAVAYQSLFMHLIRITFNMQRSAKAHTPTSVHTTLCSAPSLSSIFFVVVSISPDASEKVCNGCRRPIEDQFHFTISPDTEWHVSCLLCFKCNSTLEGSGTCFMKEGRPYCRRDYVQWVLLFDVERRDVRFIYLYIFC